MWQNGRMAENVFQGGYRIWGRGLKLDWEVYAG